MPTRKLLFILLSLLPFLSATAQQEADTVYVFRFVSHKDMFYIPWQGNGTQLDKLLSLVETHKSAILSGEAPLLVDGYCDSQPTAAANLALAKTRSNRVKSELILAKGVTESNFITHNHAEPYGNLRHVVIVRLRLPKQEPVAEVPREESAETDNKDIGNKKEGFVQESLVQESLIQETPKQESLVQETPKQETFLQETPKQEPPAEPASTVGETLSAARPFPLSLRANLLRWASLTPDLGIEWRINRHWGVLLNGSWTSWSWDSKNRRYALWKISPEVRYYLGKQRKGFLGAMYHLGEFHYKFGSTGRQGDYRGGGLTGGYRLTLNRSLALDFHAAAGYSRADYDEYSLIRGFRIRQQSKDKNYWGINQLGVSLIWKLY